MVNELVKHCVKVARRAVVDLYIGGTNGRFFWPYRLQPADEATPSVRRSSLKYILDSGFTNDGSIDTDELIEAAETRDPTHVIPNDAISDDETGRGEAIRETARRTAEFLDRVNERRLGCTVIVPLQPPYDAHYRLLRDEYPRQARRRHFALGGLKDERPPVQVAHVRRFREAVGWDVYAHGFGLGSSRHLIETLREEPALLDSVDVSTPQQHARTGRVAGASRRPVYIGPSTGTDASTTAGAFATAELVDMARMLAPDLTDDEDLDIDWERLGADQPDGNAGDADGAASLDPVDLEVTEPL